MTKNNPFPIQDNIFIKCFYSAYLTVSSAWTHSDEKIGYNNLVLICSGQGQFTFNDKEFIVNKGDIVFFPAGVKRIMKTNGGTLCFRSINFIYTFVSEQHRQWSAEHHNLPLEFISNVNDKMLFKKIEQLFIQIHKCHIKSHNKPNFRTSYHITELLSLLLNDTNDNVSFSEKHIVDNSINYMSAHFKEKITLNELAELSGKSISYYGKIFKNVTGMSPIEYLLSIRISYAKTLLENGLSVTEVSRMCGFANLYYFSKTFKSKEKMSPSEYVDICNLTK